MTLMDHLRELRTRLIWIVGSLLIGTLIAMLFSEAIVRFIIGPLSVSGTVPLVIDPTAPIGIFFQVSLTTGAILALPIILYQIIAFSSCRGRWCCLASAPLSPTLCWFRWPWAFCRDSGAASFAPTGRWIFI
jgi:hypothetical protein